MHLHTLGITEINAAIGQMGQITQNNAASAEETAASAEELKTQAVRMKESVGDLNRMLRGKAACPEAGWREVAVAAEVNGKRGKRNGLAGGAIKVRTAKLVLEKVNGAERGDRN